MAMAVKCIGSPVAHVALNGFNAVTETFDQVDWMSFRALAAAKVKGKKGVDPDFPSLHQAMTGPDWEEWQAAMNKELQTLHDMRTWTVVPRQMAKDLGARVIKSTWALRQKRTPDGQPTKKKARLCVRGDQQIAGVDYFESHSPVVQWSSV